MQVSASHLMPNLRGPDASLSLSLYEIGSDFSPQRPRHTSRLHTLCQIPKALTQVSTSHFIISAQTSLLNGHDTNLGRALHPPPLSVLGASGAGIQIMDLFTVIAVPVKRRHFFLNDDRIRVLLYPTITSEHPMVVTKQSHITLSNTNLKITIQVLLSMNLYCAVPMGTLATTEHKKFQCS